MTDVRQVCIGRLIGEQGMTVKEAYLKQFLNKEASHHVTAQRQMKKPGLTLVPRVSLPPVPRRS